MIDHLVYAVPDLEAAVQDLTERLGVAPSLGGQHVGRGSKNYLLSLGDGAYLEIIGPDPDQPPPADPRLFGLDGLQRPYLATWAAKAPDIERRVESARVQGYDPGPVSPLSRTLPDGTLLTWKLTPSVGETFPNPVPFLIDWGGAPHPSLTASQGAHLVEFRAESPNPDDVRAKLHALGVTLDLDLSAQAVLIATVRGPGGSATLR